MRSIAIFALLLTCTNCLGQSSLDVEKIYDSDLENYTTAIMENDSSFASSRTFWMQFEEYSLLGLRDFGVKYLYDFEEKKLIRYSGLFDQARRLDEKFNRHGNLNETFYIEDNIIGWLTRSTDAQQQVFRFIDLTRNIKREKIFYVPKSLTHLDPIVIDTSKLLFERFVLNSDNSIDTLRTDINTRYAFIDDKVLMRKNSFMVERFPKQQNPNVQPGFNALDYNTIEGGRIVTRKVEPKNIKISEYTVECSHDDVWLLSHKTHPHKFALYDAAKDKVVPFELDKAIFNLENLSLIEPYISEETAPSSDVRFSYFTAMNEKSLYIYLIKKGIKLYRVSDYRKMLD
jgi:hypothetical protein